MEKIKYEIHKYDIPTGITSTIDYNGLSEETDKFCILYIIHILNSNISYCYYWPVRVYEA